MTLSATPSRGGFAGVRLTPRRCASTWRAPERSASCCERNCSCAVCSRVLSISARANSPALCAAARPASTEAKSRLETSRTPLRSSAVRPGETAPTPSISSGRCLAISSRPRCCMVSRRRSITSAMVGPARISAAASYVVALWRHSNSVLVLTEANKFTSCDRTTILPSPEDVRPVSIRYIPTSV